MSFFFSPLFLFLPKSLPPSKHQGETAKEACESTQQQQNKKREEQFQQPERKTEMRMKKLSQVKTKGSEEPEEESS